MQTGDIFQGKQYQQCDTKREKMEVVSTACKREKENGAVRKTLQVRGLCCLDESGER